MNIHLTLEQLGDLADEHSVSASTSAEAPGDERQHLSICAECRTRLDELRSLLGRARALPAEIEPPPDVWIGVRETIESGKVVPIRAGSSRGRWTRSAGLAAAAVILVVVTATISVVVTRASMSTAAGPLASEPLAVPTTPASLITVDRSYAPTLEQLLAALAANKGALAPATVARVDRSLRVIDAAIAEVRDALTQDPGNTTLVEILSASYRQKIELLRRANELVPTSVP
jgi:hypothetical protein